MRAGEMRYRLQLLRPVYSEDRFGSQQVTYTPTATARAERVKQSGRQTDEAAEHFHAYTTEWNIRDGHEVGEHWRVRQLGGYLYEVTAIVPNRRRGMLTLVCERVNE